MAERKAAFVVGYKGRTEVWSEGLGRTLLSRRVAKGQINFFKRKNPGANFELRRVEVKSGDRVITRRGRGTEYIQ